MSYLFEEKEIEPQPVLVGSVTCPTADIGRTLHETIGRVRCYMADQRIEPLGPPFTRYTSWSGDACTLEAGFPTADAFSGSEEIHCAHLPGGRVLTTIHVGSYDGLCEAYAALEQRMAELGHKSGGHPWEVYLSGAEAEGAETETAIYWPIRKDTKAAKA